jgi:hypothetical protein
MGVEAGKDLGDLPEIAIDELTETTVVVDCPSARSPSDEELEVGDTERVLDVHGEEADTKGVLCGRPDVLVVRPLRRLAGAVLVRDPPDLADAARIEMCRERKLRHVR